MTLVAGYLRVSILPVLLLLGFAAQHFWLVQTQHLSPWLGAGFGMFAHTDDGESRRVHLFLLLDNGLEHPVELSDIYRDILERSRSLPSEDWLGRLAAVAMEAVEEDAAGVPLSGEPVSLRIEIWRNRYGVNTLEARSVRVQSRTFPWFSG